MLTLHVCRLKREFLIRDSSVSLRATYCLLGVHCRSPQPVQTPPFAQILASPGSPPTDLQSDEVIPAKQAMDTQSTTITDCADGCSIYGAALIWRDNTSIMEKE